MGTSRDEQLVRRAVITFMAGMGAAIAVLWGRDIRSSPEIDRSGGLLRARERSTRELFLPHWIAEYATAATLIAGAVGLAARKAWAAPVSLAALGALIYASTSALGWALAARERLPYATPMVLGLAGGLASIAALLRAPRAGDGP